MEQDATFVSIKIFSVSGASIWNDQWNQILDEMITRVRIYNEKKNNTYCVDVSGMLLQ